MIITIRTVHLVNRKLFERKVFNNINTMKIYNSQDYIYLDLTSNSSNPY